MINEDQAVDAAMDLFLDATECEATLLVTLIQERGIPISVGMLAGLAGTYEGDIHAAIAAVTDEEM